jgi:hypothetical protein
MNIAPHEPASIYQTLRGSSIRLSLIRLLELMRKIEYFIMSTPHLSRKTKEHSLCSLKVDRREWGVPSGSLTIEPKP